MPRILVLISLDLQILTSYNTEAMKLPGIRGRAVSTKNTLHFFYLQFLVIILKLKCLHFSAFLYSKSEKLDT